MKVLKESVLESMLLLVREVLVLVPEEELVSLALVMLVHVAVLTVVVEVSVALYVVVRSVRMLVLASAAQTQTDDKGHSVRTTKLSTSTHSCPFPQELVPEQGCTTMSVTLVLYRVFVVIVTACLTHAVTEIPIFPAYHTQAAAEESHT